MASNPSEPTRPGQPEATSPEVAPRAPDIDIPAPQSDPGPDTGPIDPVDLGDFA